MRAVTIRLIVPTPDETSRIRFDDASVPTNYEELLAPVIFEPWAKLLLETAQISSGDAVLDVACGTGVVSRRAAAAAGPSGRVVALDVSAPMLERARAGTSHDGAAPTEFVEGSALDLPLADASFDRVVCQQGLQFFPDKPAALAEFRRVLRPGGTVTVAVWEAGHRLEPFESYMEALIAAKVEPPFENAFDRGPVSTVPARLRTLLEQAAFDPIEVAVKTITLQWPEPGLAAAGIMGTPFAPLVQALVPHRRHAIQADLVARFAPHAPDAPVLRESASVIAHASRR